MSDSKSNPSKSSKDDLSVSNLPDKDAGQIDSVKGGMVSSMNAAVCQPKPKDKCILGTNQA